MLRRLSIQRRSSRILAAALAGVVGGASLLSAQDDRGDRGRDRGGFGGPGGGFGGPPGGFSFGGRGGGRGDGALGQLQSESTRIEIGVTPDQQSAIDKLNDERRAAQDQMRGQFDFRNASDEQRTAMFDEMRKAGEKQQLEFEGKLKGILKPEQFTRLQQIALHRSGPTSLLRDDMAAEFKITDEQKAQFQKIQDESRERMRDMFRGGGGGGREDFERMRAETEAKYLAVLTPAQQQLWKDRLGPPPKEMNNTPTPFLSGPGSPAPAPRIQRIEAPVVGPVVMSFDTATKASNAPQPSKEEFKFSFNGAPWDDVLEMFAKKAGLTLDVHDIPPGTFTYFDNKTYTPIGALDVINRHLADRGYILIRRDNALVCYNYETTKISPNLIPNVTVDDLASRGEHELLSLTLPVVGVAVDQVAKDIDAMKGPQGSVVALPSTNTIVVTDLGANLRRIAAMVKDIVPASENGLQFKAYPLQWIAAEDAEPVISQQLGVAQTVANVSSSNERRSFGGGFPPFGGFDRGRDGGDRGSSSSSSSSRTTATPTPNAKVQAETRLNNLLVTATPAQHKVVEEVLRVWMSMTAVARSMSPQAAIAGISRFTS